MLSRNKIFFILFLFVLLFEMLAVELVKPLDELMLMLFLLVIALDLVANKDFSRYKSLFVLEGIFLFYFFFSLLFRDFNTAGAIANDFILEQKAFVPFIVAYAMAPRFTAKMKTVLKVVSVGTALVLPVLFFLGLTKAVLGHVYHYGTISVSVSLLYLYCSIDDNGKVPLRDMIVGILLLSVGLLSTRSKFFGEYVAILFMLFVYRPGLVRHLNMKHALVIALSLVCVVLVAWPKVEFYFISGAAEAFTNATSPDEMSEMIARPVLYATMFLVLCDFPVFGSGLASFASHSSSSYVNYSSLYTDYGISQVYGLSERMSDFVADTYYPVLAQFGIVGIILYVGFWVWIWQKLRIVLHLGRVVEFIIGVSAIGFILIEGVAGATAMQIGGYVPMMLLGMIVAGCRTMDKAEIKEILSNDLIKK